MNSYLLFKTRTPYSYYAWIAFNIAFFVFLVLNNPIIETLIGAVISGLFSYLIICRYACKVELYNDKIIATYLFPYLHKTEVRFGGSERIVYELGYYYYFSDEHGFSKVQYLHPHDIIYFYTAGNEQKLYNRININTNYFDLKKIRKYLETDIKLIKVNKVY
jgi:hypothetical protein